MHTELLIRVWVLLLFAVRPWLPGYRGLRLPLSALAVALLDDCPSTTAPLTRRRHPRDRAPV